MRNCRLALLVVVMAVAAVAGAQTRRVAVFEAAGPGSPPADLLTEIDATVRRHLLFALPPDDWSTFMGGPAAPGCTGRCAVDRAAEYGADLALAVRVTITGDELRVELKVYAAPEGVVRVSRVAVAGQASVLMPLVGRAATEVAEILVAGRPAPKTVVLTDAAADSTAAAAEVDRWRAAAGVNSVGMNLIFVEPGRPFREPPEDQKYIQARPLPEPTAPFLLAATEVTQAQWSAVLDDCPSHFTDDDRPVESVTWIDAVRFCNALSRHEGLTVAYSVTDGAATWDNEADGYRLPTDAEWEYACRAGSLTMFNSGGRSDDLKRVAWFDRNSGGHTRDVADREPNDWGFHDVHGNVWEWVWDLYATLPDFSPDNVESPGIGPDRTIRGGSWYSDAKACRTTNFCRIDPSFANNDLGLRVARTP